MAIVSKKILEAKKLSILAFPPGRCSLQKLFAFLSHFSRSLVRQLRKSDFQNSTNLNLARTLLASNHFAPLVESR